MTDPIARIEWRHVDTLKANDYNPNICHGIELDLLERSILKTGWVQPILITGDGTIIDGFHRYMLARESPSLKARYAGRVPCAVLDIDRAEAMIVTIRMNRAKGSHVALRMADMVGELVDAHGVTVDAIAAGIGATRDEVELLYQNDVFKARKLDDYRYSEAWQAEPDTVKGERVAEYQARLRQNRLNRRLRVKG